MLPLPLQNQGSNNLTTNPGTTSDAIGVGVKTQIRPSSPRHFFARLYGHLENNRDSSVTRSQLSTTTVAATIETNLKTSCADGVLTSTYGSPANCDINYQSDGATTTSSPDILISDER